MKLDLHRRHKYFSNFSWCFTWAANKNYSIIVPIQLEKQILIFWHDKLFADWCKHACRWRSRTWKKHYGSVRIWLWTLWSVVHLPIGQEVSAFHRVNITEYNLASALLVLCIGIHWTNNSITNSTEPRQSRVRSTFTRKTSLETCRCDPFAHFFFLILNTKLFSCCLATSAVHHHLFNFFSLAIQPFTASHSKFFFSHSW